MSSSHEANSKSNRFSGRRKWRFRLAALLFPFVLLPVTEAIFRFADIGRDLNLVVSNTADLAESSTFSHRFNSAADLPFFGQSDIAGPEPRPFNLPKPKNTYRIVVVGGSTVIGFPYGPDLAFPRQIEHQLKRQNPELNVEVLNAGVTSLNSFAVNDLVAQSLDADPDLIVIHTGHNEFYGPGGPASTAFNLSPSVIRSCYRLRRWRLVQKLASLTSAPSQLTDDLMDVLPRQLAIPADGPIFKQAARNYEQNLQLMLQTCSDSGVPVLLTTVACNLRDQSPLNSDWKNSRTMGRDEWESQMSMTRELIVAGQFQDALDALSALSADLSVNADFCYRQGQCYFGLGRLDDAWKAFSNARDLDLCRFRAPSRFETVVRDVAASNPSCTFLDLINAIRSESEGAPPGYNLFLEHVHYNFEGHVLIGRLIAKAIQSQILGGQWDPDVTADVDTMKELLGFLPEDDLAATSFAIQVFQTQPFSRTLDKDLHMRHLAARAEKIFTSLPPERSAAFAELKMNQMSDGRLHFLMLSHQNNGNESFVQELQDLCLKRKPWALKGP